MSGSLPSETEIGLLPRWARVALAARCGRRLQALMATAPGVTHAHCRIVDRAVGAAELERGVRDHLRRRPRRGV